MKKILVSIVLLGGLAAASPATAQRTQSREAPANRFEARGGSYADRGAPAQAREGRRGGKHGHAHWREGRGNGHRKGVQGKRGRHCHKGGHPRGPRRGGRR